MKKQVYSIVPKQKTERPVMKTPQPLLSPIEVPKNIRIALTLLLHHPAIGAKIQLSERIIHSTIPGTATLIKILDIIQNHPTITAGGLISYF